MAVRVNMPQRQGGRGLQINPIQAQGRQLQAAAPAPPKQDYSAIGKSMIGLGNQLQESRQKANRAKLVQSLVLEDDMGEGEAFNATVPQVQADGMEGMMQDSGVMGGPSAPATPKASRLSQLNMPDQAKAIFKEMVKSGDTDGAYKIAMKFALQPPKEYSLGKDDVVTDATGKIIAKGPESAPKDSRTNNRKDYEAAKADGSFTGSFPEFLEKYKSKSGTTVNVGKDVKLPAPPKGYYYKQALNPAGGVENVTLEKIGGVADPEQQKTRRALESSIDNASSVFRDIDIAEDLLENPSKFMGMSITTGVGGSLAQNIPTSTAQTLRNTIDGIGSFISADSLAQMRANSPTGGALGNTSNADLQLLRDAHGRMDPFGDPKVLKRQLKDFKELLTKVVARNRARAMEIGGMANADLEAGVTSRSLSSGSIEPPSKQRVNQLLNLYK